MKRKVRLELISVRIRECLDFLFDTRVVDTDTEYHDGRHPKKILSRYERRKKGKHPEAYLDQQCPFMTLVFSLDMVMGEETKGTTNQLDAALLKNGIGNTQKHVGMSGNISP